MYSLWERREKEGEGSIGDKKGKFLKLLEFTSDQKEKELYRFFLENVVQYLVGAVAFNDELSMYTNENGAWDKLCDAKTEALAMIVLEDKLHVWKYEAEYEAKNGGERLRKRAKRKKRKVDDRVS